MSAQLEMPVAGFVSLSNDEMISTNGGEITTAALIGGAFAVAGTLGAVFVVCAIGGAIYYVATH